MNEPTNLNNIQQFLEIAQSQLRAFHCQMTFLLGLVNEKNSNLSTFKKDRKNWKSIQNIHKQFLQIYDSGQTTMSQLGRAQKKVEDLKQRMDDSKSIKSKRSKKISKKKKKPKKKNKLKKGNVICKSVSKFTLPDADDWYYRRPKFRSGHKSFKYPGDNSKIHVEIEERFKKVRNLYERLEEEFRQQLMIRSSKSESIVLLDMDESLANLSEIDIIPNEINKGLFDSRKEGSSDFELSGGRMTPRKKEEYRDFNPFPSKEETKDPAPLPNILHNLITNHNTLVNENEKIKKSLMKEIEEQKKYEMKQESTFHKFEEDIPLLEEPKKTDFQFPHLMITPIKQNKPDRIIPEIKISSLLMPPKILKTPEKEEKFTGLKGIKEEILAQLVNGRYNGLFVASSTKRSIIDGIEEAILHDLKVEKENKERLEQQKAQTQHSEKFNKFEQMNGLERVEEVIEPEEKNQIICEKKQEAVKYLEENLKYENRDHSKPIIENQIGNIQWNINDREGLASFNMNKFLKRKSEKKDVVETFEESDKNNCPLIRELNRREEEEVEKKGMEDMNIVNQKDKKQIIYHNVQPNEAREKTFAVPVRYVTPKKPKKKEFRIRDWLLHDAKPIAPMNTQKHESKSPKNRINV